MMINEKIRIRLKAYDYRILDQSTSEIVDTARRTGARVAGPRPRLGERMAGYRAGARCAGRVAWAAWLLAAECGRHAARPRTRRVLPHRPHSAIEPGQRTRDGTARSKVRRYCDRIDFGARKGCTVVIERLDDGLDVLTSHPF